MKLSQLTILCAFLTLAPLAAGCGGESACESAGAALCEAACACGGDDGCIMADTGATITFDSEADCRGFFITLGCMGDDGSRDSQFEACTTATESAQCVDPGDGTSAVDIPGACDIQ